MIGHSRADLFMQFSLWPVRGLDLAVQQQVLLGGHVLKEDVILHAHPELSANVVDVGLHVSAVHLNGARRWGEKASQERPVHNASLLGVWQYWTDRFIKYHSVESGLTVNIELPIIIWE